MSKKQISVELYHGSNYHPFTKTAGYIKISKKIMEQHTRAKEIEEAIEQYIKKKKKRSEK
jgi:hypothetical protein